LSKKLLFPALLLLFFIFAVSVQSQGKCIKGDCRNGKGVYVADDGRRYEGEFKDGAIHGQGTLVQPDGTIYSGQFRDGRFHGKGKLHRPDGRRYKGEFFKNVIHGKGTMEWSDGTLYVGEFSHGLFHGDGVLISPDGREYKGEFRNNIIDGRGKLVIPENSVIKTDMVMVFLKPMTVKSTRVCLLTTNTMERAHSGTVTAESIVVNLKTISAMGRGHLNM